MKLYAMGRELVSGTLIANGIDIRRPDSMVWELRRHESTLFIKPEGGTSACYLFNLLEDYVMLHYTVA